MSNSENDSPSKRQNVQQSATTSFTLLSQMMGASLLSLPSLVQKLGVPAMVVLFTFAMIFNLWTYNSFVEAASYTKSTSYREMVGKIFGKKASIILDIAVIVLYFGITTAYMVIAAQNYISFFQQVANFDANSYATKAVIAVIIFSLCLLRNLSSLGKVASIASVTIFIFTFTIIAYFFIGLGDKRLCPESSSYGLVISPEVGPFMTFVNFLAYFPSTQGSFTAHNMIPTMYSEMAGPIAIKKKLLKVALIVACVSAFFLYMLAGIMGAAIFGQEIKDNLIISFQPCKLVWIYVMQFCYGLVVIIVYPLVIYPIKVSFSNYFPQFTQWKVHLTVSTIVVISTMSLAMALESILAIFGFFSAFTGFFILIYFPLRIYQILPRLEKEHKDKDTTADSLAIVIGAMALPGNLSDNMTRMRTLSDKFKQVEEGVDNQIPILSRKSFEKSFNVEQTYENKNMQELSGQEATSSVVGDIIIPINEVDKTEMKKRCIIGWCWIAFGFVSCVVGSVINFMDILKTFGA